MTPMVKEVMGIGAVGSILAYLRSIPVFFWTKAKAQYTVNIDIPAVGDADEAEIIKWLEIWMGGYTAKVARNLKAIDQYNNSTGNYSFRLTKDVVNNPGWFKYKGKRMLVRCHRREAGTTGKVLYDYSITFFTRDHNIASEFLSQIEKEYNATIDNKVTSMIFEGGGWRKIKDINVRSFESVVLPLGDAQKIKDDLDQFLNRKDLYKNLNITHKRGYLFEGLPGSGKSSMANAIATYLGWNLYAFNKTDIKPGTLSSAFSEIKSRSVVLLEDIDTYKINRKSDKESADTGDWLNWLDGINTPNDTIFVLTTNYVENLDSALIRPGRVDFSMHFDFATEYQIRESFKRFHLYASNEEIENFVARHKDKNVVMADIQNDLFKLYVPAWSGLETAVKSPELTKQQIITTSPHITTFVKENHVHNNNHSSAIGFHAGVSNERKDKYERVYSVSPTG
jgi:chaperone BCS1